MRVTVFCHGYNGSSQDWNALKGKCDGLSFFPTSNNYLRSWTGIKKCGHALAEELAEYFKLLALEHKEINLTIVGHSFGGIYSRHAIHLLFGPTSVYEWKMKINLVSFVTIASPHLGVRRPKGVSLSQTAWRVCSDYVGWVGGQTACDLLLWNTELVSIADPDHIATLAKFKHHTLIGAARFDETVGYCSAMILKDNEYAHLTKDGECQIFDNGQVTVSQLPDNEKPTISSDGSLEFDTRVFNALNKITWNRVVVDFGVTRNSWIFPVHIMFIGKLRLFSFSCFDVVEYGKRAASTFASHLISKILIDYIS
jgi:hypothetical protein